MRHIREALLNFYIYSSIHVSLAATLFALELFFIAGQDIESYFVGFVFSSTLLIYALHRIIGLRSVAPSERTDRYQVIQKFKSQILIYALLSTVAVAYCASRFSMDAIKFFVPAGIISILYVLPLFGGKRLRDLSFIKVFLIAVVWAYVGMLALEPLSVNVSLTVTIVIFCERFFYILGVTLPFDYRDKKIDQSNNVKTLGTVLSTKSLYRAITVAIIISAVAWSILYFSSDLISGTTYLIALIAIAITTFCIYIGKGKTKDIYYSGLLDGVIALRSLLIIGSLVL